MGRAFADVSGQQPAAVARHLMVQVCEHTLHLDDFEQALPAALPDWRATAPGEAGPDQRAATGGAQRARDLTITPKSSMHRRRRGVWSLRRPHRRCEPQTATTEVTRMNPDDEARVVAGTAGDPEVLDVLYLAGQLPPDEGAWLLVTAADGAPGGEFTVQRLTGTAPSGYGGDVLVRLVREEPSAGQPAPTVGVSVYAVAGGRLILVASWPGSDPEGWPERIRPAVTFAMGMLSELEEHGADLGGLAEPDHPQAGGMSGVVPRLASSRPAGAAF
jgi:hypothetical protein